jgi:hypothetical protein
MEIRILYREHKKNKMRSSNRDKEAIRSIRIPSADNNMCECGTIRDNAKRKQKMGQRVEQRGAGEMEWKNRRMERGKGNLNKKKNRNFRKMKDMGVLRRKSEIDRSSLLYN